MSQGHHRPRAHLLRMKLWLGRPEKTRSVREQQMAPPATRFVQEHQMALAA